MSSRSLIFAASALLSSFSFSNGAVLPRDSDSATSLQDVATSSFNATYAIPPTFQIKFQAADSNDAGSISSEASMSYSILTLRNIVLAPVASTPTTIKPFTDSYSASNLAIALSGWPAANNLISRSHLLWGFEALLQSVASSPKNQLGTYFLYYEGKRTARIEFKHLDPKSSTKDITLPSDHAAPSTMLASSAKNLMLVSTPGQHDLPHTTHCLALARALLQITYATDAKTDAQLTNNIAFNQDNVQLVLSEQAFVVGGQTQPLTLGQAVQMIGYAAEVPLARGTWSDDTIGVEQAVDDSGAMTSVAQLRFVIEGKGDNVQEVTPTTS